MHSPDLEVYGQDHSPWVQAVLLGLYEKDVAHALRTVPPFSVFTKWGVMMPAASVNGEPWQLESADILQRVGFEPMSSEDTRAIYHAWQGVLHRPDSALRFFNGFSLAGDPGRTLARRLRNNFLRSFATLYFYLLIRFRVLTNKPPDPDNFGDQFLYWEEKLRQTEGPFLAGEFPNTPDMMLFGIIQCHCSIPVPPVEALQKDPRLTQVRAWISAMHVRFSEYQHLYSGVYFEPYTSPPVPANGLERAAFWVGSALMIVAFPITVPLIAFFVARVHQSPSNPI